MKKFLAILGVFIGLIVVVSTFLALNTEHFNKYSKMNKLDKIRVLSFVQRNADSASFEKLTDVQRGLAIKISKNLKQTEHGNYLLYFLVSLGLAFIYGMVHSLGPGHGKLLMSSYFLSEKPKLLEAPVLAFQISAIHIASAIVMVFLLNLTLDQVLTVGYEKAFWGKIISYSFTIFVGMLLLFKKIFANKLEESSISLNRIVLPLAAGMVPCTGALLVLLYSMANNTLFMGVIMVIAIGLGIATTLTALGIVTLISKKVVTLETPFTKGRNIGLTFEYIGVFAIITLGIVMLTLTLAGELITTLIELHLI